MHPQGGSLDCSLGGALPHSKARLEELQLQLDKAWDYLRQRRALRHSGENPNTASMRDGGTVEEYEQ